MPTKYELTDNPDLIFRPLDRAYIPRDPANRDYIDYLVWLEQGNKPDTAPPPASPAAVINQSSRALALALARAHVAQGKHGEALAAILDIIEKD